MTRSTGDNVAGRNADSFARDWQALRADGDIQFAPLQAPQPNPPPDWWLAFLDFLGSVFGPLADAIGAIAGAIGMSGQALMWVLLALAVLFAGVLLWRHARRLVDRRADKADGEETPEWAPDAGEALALLEEADRLAAAGHYDEATHLLLKRSVGQIASARPGLLDPSSTAREIASLPDLSEAARRAFATIAGRVERSLFALRALNADDWREARAAYADFALAAPLAA